MKTLPDAPLRYRVAASLLFGGMSLSLFGFVVFALLQQADRATANQAWDWVFTTALIVLIAAVGALSGLIALGAMRDPKSRLGAWARKRPLVDVVQYVLFEAAMLVLILFGLWCLGIK